MVFRNKNKQYFLLVDNEKADVYLLDNYLMNRRLSYGEAE